MIKLKENAPNVIDLFCGIGGASLGFKQAGYNIRLGVDIDGKACEIFTHNIDSKIITKDINNYTPSECLNDAKIEKEKLDLLICCPPCQGFSRINKNGEGDPRNKLVEKTLEFILYLKPKVVVFENVPGILAEKYKEKLDLFISKLKENRYLFSDNLRKNHLLNAANYGIPQTRKRFILIAVNKDSGMNEISELKKTHSQKNNDFEKWKTVKDAIFNLKKLKSGEKDSKDKYHYAPSHTERILKMIEKVREFGGSHENLPDEYKLECHKKFDGHQDVYGIMDWNKPAPTLTAGWHTPSKGRYIHPKDNRGLTIREACRLQTFPDNFDFLNASKQQISTYIGNAVPVELIRIIANHVANEMNWEDRLDRNNNISFWKRIIK